MHHHLIGIKGTGLSHLASYLRKGGDVVTGCDVDADFFTAPLLDGIEVLPLDASLPPDVDDVIYSSAYEKRMPRALKEAQERGVRCMSYPEALAWLCAGRTSVGIAGTHGKTTTCAAATHAASSMGLDAGSVYGSFLQGTGSAWRSGDRGLILEACEYQDHFLLYDLDILVITSIEFDHPDYFEDLAAVRKSFRERIVTMPQGAVVIYHDALARIAKDWEAERPDLTYVPYGPKGRFSLSPIGDGEWLCPGVGARFHSPITNRVIMYDLVAGALAAVALELSLQGHMIDEASLSARFAEVLPMMGAFPGVTARQEVMADGDVTIIDDYAHHPTEIRTLLDELHKRYRGRRIVFLFAPHTASRTRMLMKDFVNVLSRADAVFIQDLYSSARSDDDASAADELYRLLDRHLTRTFYGRMGTVARVRGDDEAASRVASFLMPGDVLVTLGAGDNRRLVDKITKFRSMV